MQLLLKEQTVAKEVSRTTSKGTRGDFLKLRPPTYDGTDPDPLVADDWLKEMEKKLDLTTFTDDECVGAATHQLTGAARVAEPPKLQGPHAPVTVQ